MQILGDKEKFMYIPNNNNKNYHFCIDSKFGLAGLNEQIKILWKNQELLCQQMRNLVYVTFGTLVFSREGILDCLCPALGYRLFHWHFPLKLPA